MKTKLTLLASALMLIGCSSVSDSIPTVKIEKRKPKTTVQAASYPTDNYVTAATYQKTITSASPEDAASVCETDSMRNRVLDGNDNNDSVRIMVVQDSAGSSELLSEAEINCRDYFLQKSIRPVQPKIIQSSTSSIETPTTITRTIDRSAFTYIVQRGDTVWDIARRHCTNVKAISRLNGLGRGHIIDVGQRLKMPDQVCD